MATVIVTGSSGFIGGETVLKLYDAGHTVIGIDKEPPSQEIARCLETFFVSDFSELDISNIVVTDSVTAIVHCAGTSLVGPSMSNPELYYNNNFINTKNMIDSIVKNKLNVRIIFSSSAAVYGEPIMVPCQEVDPTIPISPYGESKLMIEMLLKSYTSAYGLDFVAFRYFNVCGADSQGRHGQNSGATHIIARVLESIKNQTEFKLYGDQYPTKDGTCIRDYIHVEDVADAHVMALDAPVGIYNLGDGAVASNKQIINAAERITGESVNLNVCEARSGDPAELTASSFQARNVMGWQAKHNLDSIIHSAWKWYNGI